MICFAKSLLINCIFCEFTMDPLSFLCFYYGVTIFLAESLWIHFMFRDFTRESPSIAQIPYKLTRYFGIILYIHFLFRNHYVLLVSRIDYEFTSVFANSLWIYHLFREFTKDLLSYLRIHYEFTIFFSNSLSIHYLFREFTIFFANSLWIYYFRLLHNDNMYVMMTSWYRNNYVKQKSLRHSRSDSYAISCGLLVICYKYFIFSNNFFRIFEHDLAAIFYLNHGVIYRRLEFS